MLGTVAPVTVRVGGCERLGAEAAVAVVVANSVPVWRGVWRWMESVGWEAEPGTGLAE